MGGNVPVASQQQCRLAVLPAKGRDSSDNGWGKTLAFCGRYGDVNDFKTVQSVEVNQSRTNRGSERRGLLENRPLCGRARPLCKCLGFSWSSTVESMCFNQTWRTLHNLILNTNS
ncbi:hypothetical protein AOLI_G00068550 [Acnodon oligacanthus]